MDAVPVDRYLRFVWEHAKYPHRRALPELVQHLRQTVSETDEESSNIWRRPTLIKRKNCKL